MKKKKEPYFIPLPEDLYRLVKKEMRTKRIRKFGGYVEMLLKKEEAQLLQRSSKAHSI